MTRDNDRHGFEVHFLSKCAISAAAAQAQCPATRTAQVHVLLICSPVSIRPRSPRPPRQRPATINCHPKVSPLRGVRSKLM